MKKLTPKSKAILAYTLYGILLCAGLLYFRFPKDSVRDYITASVQRSNPRLRLDIGDVRPSLPFGVRLFQAVLSLREISDAKIFVAERLTLRPALWAFLKGVSGYKFDSDAYGGNLNGYIRFSKEGNEQPFSASVTLKNIYLDENTYLLSSLERNVSGILHGVITYRGLTDGTGEADLKILEGNMALRKPFFDLSSIEFEALLIKLLYKGSEIDISYAKMTGSKIQGAMSGTVRLKNNFMESGLALSGTLELLSGLFDGKMGDIDAKDFFNKPMEMPFTVQGTIKKPKFKFR